MRAAVEAIADAIERGDRTALDTLYHDSLTVYRAGRVEMGRAGRRGGDLFTGEGADAGYPVRIEGLSVHLENGTAWSTFRYSRGTAGDGLAARGVATLVFREVEDAWRVIHAHLSEEM